MDTLANRDRTGPAAMDTLANRDRTGPAATDTLANRDRTGPTATDTLANRDRTGPAATDTLANAANPWTRCLLFGTRRTYIRGTTPVKASNQEMSSDQGGDQSEKRSQSA
jgi:hypothetical protein